MKGHMNCNRKYQSLHGIENNNTYQQFKYGTRQTYSTNEGKKDYTSFRHRSLTSINYSSNLIKRYINPLINLIE